MNSIEKKYRSWINNNQTIFDLFERFAGEAYDHGKKFSISLLTERIRWEVRMTWARNDGFKISNNFRAYIARDLLALHPEYGAFLRTRPVLGE